MRSSIQLSLSLLCVLAVHAEQEPNGLVARADSGDDEAAYRLFDYYNFSARDYVGAAKWLNRAAELGNPEAQRGLAEQIIIYGSPHQAFGKTPQEAVLRLLSEASKKDGSAASQLGMAYRSGYFGETDKESKAREAFQLAASLHDSTSWKHLAALLHSGEGGNVDPVEAYYYVCLATAWTHPDSAGGKELWVLRHKIEETISLLQANNVWKRVDVYVSEQRVRSGGQDWPPPLLGTAVPEDQWNEWVKATDAFETRQRVLLRSKKAEFAPSDGDNHSN